MEEDNLEKLINDLNVETPTAVELEKHGRFLGWLSTLDEKDFYDALDNFVIPALEFALPAFGASENLIRGFYKAKFLFSLFEKWEKESKND